MNRKSASCFVLAVANFFTGILHLMSGNLLFIGWFLVGSTCLVGVFYYRGSEENDADVECEEKRSNLED